MVKIPVLCNFQRNAMEVTEDRQDHLLAHKLFEDTNHRQHCNVPEGAESDFDIFIWQGQYLIMTDRQTGLKVRVACLNVVLPVLLSFLLSLFPYLPK